jgi:hypothetical protein
VQDPWPGFTGAEYVGPISTTANAVQQLGLSTPVVIMNASPNPFINLLSFRYKMDVQGSVRIDVMDINGKTVSVINEGNKAPGDYTTQLNTSNLSAGSYVAVLSVNNARAQTIKLVKAQ